MYINAVAGSVMLCLQHGFYNIIFKIEHKLCIASGSALPSPPPPKRKIVGAHLRDLTGKNMFHFVCTASVGHIFHSDEYLASYTIHGQQRGGGVFMGNAC
jgi:hypothetical protein